MQTNFFDHIDIRPENTHVPNLIVTPLFPALHRYTL